MANEFKIKFVSIDELEKNLYPSAEETQKEFEKAMKLDNNEIPIRRVKPAHLIPGTCEYKKAIEYGMGQLSPNWG